MYWKAWSIRPPLQPSLPSGLEQSTRFCSLSDTSLPVFLKCCPSIAPVVLKAQQEPHWPWGRGGWSHIKTDEEIKRIILLSPWVRDDPFEIIASLLWLYKHNVWVFTSSQPGLERAGSTGFSLQAVNVQEVTRGWRKQPVHSGRRSHVCVTHR